jgi:hypothetical protein
MARAWVAPKADLPQGGEVPKRWPGATSRTSWMAVPVRSTRPPVCGQIPATARDSLRRALLTPKVEAWDACYLAVPRLVRI